MCPASLFLSWGCLYLQHHLQVKVIGTWEKFEVGKLINQMQAWIGWVYFIIWHAVQYKIIAWGQATYEEVPFVVPALKCPLDIDVHI
jgi:hypothetical protein